MTLNMVSLTLGFVDATGSPVATGTVVITPNAVVTDSADDIVITQLPLVLNLQKNPNPVVSLIGTDNPGLSPSGWGYLIQPLFPGAPPARLYLIPYGGGSAQTLADLIPAMSVPAMATYLPTAGGTLTGTATLAGNPPMNIPASTHNGYVLTSDGSGNITPQPATTGAPTGAAGGDLAGSTYPNPVVAKIQGTTVASPPGGTTQYLRGDGNWAVPANAGGPPTGTAGGSLAGSYPNPTIAATAVTPGTYTNANLSVSADGRVTAAANGTAGSGGINPPAGDLGGTATIPTVTATHLSSPLPITQGGTAAGSATAALTSLGAFPAAGGTWTGYVAPQVVTLTYGTTISLNAALGNVFAITLTASTGTIANPTNPVDGQVIRIRVIQDGTGSRTVSWGTAYDWGAGNSAPTLSTAASKIDIAGFEYVASISKWVSLGAAFPQGY